ncbi:hypothetical protein D3C85_947350 [compost metagenome]
MGLGDGVGQDLGGAGVVLELEQGVVGAGAGAPEAEPFGLDQAGDVVGVEQARIGVRVLQAPEHLLGQPFNASDCDVGKGFVPANLFVDERPHGHGFGGGPDGARCVGGGVPFGEVTKDGHHFPLTEVGTVGFGFGRGIADAGDVGEGAQLAGDGGQFGGNRQSIEPRRADDAWGDAGGRAGPLQGLEACEGAVRFGGANDVGVGGGIGGAFCHAYHDGDGVDGVGDGLQSFGQGALGACFANGFLYVGDDDRFIEREGGRVGIVRMGDYAYHGGSDGADGAGAFTDFDDAYAVMVTVECHGGGSPVSGRR